MIHALPGLGANHRMFPAEWSALPEFQAHDWGHYAGEKSLAQAARSMIGTCGIHDGDVVVGASLGGMVACEISKQVKLKQLYLVGSAVKKEEISRFLSFLHPLAQYAPIDWIKISAGKIPSDMAQMFAGIEAASVRSMCEAIFDWEGLGESRIPLFRIHGRGDLVIPPPEKVDLLLDGGHLISVTHARECVAFIRLSIGSSRRLEDAGF